MWATIEGFRMSILPSQCHATRALLDMDLAQLARRAVVSRDTIADFKNGVRSPSANNLAAIRAAAPADPTGGTRAA